MTQIKLRGGKIKINKKFSGQSVIFFSKGVTHSYKVTLTILGKRESDNPNWKLQSFSFGSILSANELCSIGDGNSLLYPQMFRGKMSRFYVIFEHARFPEVDIHDPTIV